MWYSKVQQEHQWCWYNDAAVVQQGTARASQVLRFRGSGFLGKFSTTRRWPSLLDRKHLLLWKLKFFFGGLENFSLYQFIHNIYLYQASQKCFVTSLTKRSWLIFQLLVWNLAKALHFYVCIFICHPSQLLLTRGVGGNTSSTTVRLYRYHCACWKSRQVWFQEEDLKTHSGRDLFIQWGGL